jgi:hypothetical protein
LRTAELIWLKFFLIVLNCKEKVFTKNNFGKPLFKFFFKHFFDDSFFEFRNLECFFELKKLHQALAYKSIFFLAKQPLPGHIGREGEYTGRDNDVVLLRGGENTLRLVLSRPTVASRPIAVVRGRLEFGDRAIVARYLITIEACREDDFRVQTMGLISISDDGRPW